VADSAVALENVPVVINPLANDSDADGNDLTILLAAQGSNGTTTINDGTNALYRPNASFSGTDIFTYAITDGQGGFATNTVSVSVWPLKVTSLQRLVDGTISVQFSGIPLRSYSIQTSTNLVNWTTVALRTADPNGQFALEQDPLAQRPVIFFRAMTPRPP
jgi:hypothetical protein